MSYREKSEFHFFLRVVPFYCILYYTLYYTSPGHISQNIASHILHNNEKSLHSIDNEYGVYLKKCITIFIYDTIVCVWESVRRLFYSQRDQTSEKQ